MNKRWTLTLVGTAVALALMVSGCGKASSTTATENTPRAVRRPVVYVTNYPLYYFAHRLAGESATVVFPMKQSGDPAAWQPDPATIAEYQRADLILLNGAGYSAWVEKAALPRKTTVDTAAGFRSELITTGQSTLHSHGPGGEHSHPAQAITTWLDPRLALLHAAAIADHLARLLPSEKDTIARRLGEITTDWSAWKNDFDTLVADRRTTPVLASHPVYQYLERAGRLNWRSVHWEPGEEPSAGQWQELVALLKEHPTRWMVWEGEPAPSVRDRLARDFGISCVVFDPCGSPPAKGDLLEVMRTNLTQLRAIYAP